MTKEYIKENLLRKDGKINSRRAKATDIEEIYLVYNDSLVPKCQNNHNLKFLSFTKGYHKTTCSDLECTKSRGYKNRKQDYNEIFKKVRKTKLKKYGSETFVNVEKRKNTINKIKEEGYRGNNLFPKTNTEYLNRCYITNNFIKNNKLEPEKFKNFFSCENDWMFTKLRELEVKYTNNRGGLEGKIQIFIRNSTINNKQIIKPLELDIYSKEYSFAIEYNGLMWHSHGLSKHFKFNTPIEEPNKHLNKTILCEEKGIQLYHIFENEWLDNNKRNIWISMLRDKQGLNYRIYGRKTIVKEVSTKDARVFINENHMQGYVNASIKIGLYYNNILVSLMTFGKSRYNKEVEYELIRFCSKKNITIVGGGSKLLSFFERNYKPKSLISYANRRWSVGNFYSKVGFTFVKDTVPNFFYFHEKDRTLWSRNKFQKHKQEALLDNFSKDRTGTENMYQNGYRKIFDSGNKVFLKKY